MKKYDIIIIPHGGGKTKTLRLSSGFLYGVLILLSLFFVSVVVFALLYGPVYLKALRVSEMEREINRLREENKKILVLEEKLKELESLRDQVAQMLGVELSPPPLEVFAKYRIKSEEEREVKRDTIVKASTPEIGGVIEKALKEEKYIPGLLPVRGYISRTFSPPKHPGIDIVAPLGTPVVATADGVVVEAGYDDFFGYRVVIDHNGIYRSVYAHLEKFTVKPGERVKRGEVIGFLGSSGRSTGPHLHFEIWKGNTPENPLLYVSK